MAVLHDLNQACRYASYLIAMKDGAIVAQGRPDSVISAALVQQVFGLPCVVIDDPVSRHAFDRPQGAARSLVE